MLMMANMGDDHDRKRSRRSCDCSKSTDMISQLPNHILQHILSFLSQKEAIQTCVLSKSWRYLGPTRPNVEFSLLTSKYNGCSKLLDYLSIIDQTLLRYQDQNLCVQEFIVETDTLDPETISHVEKWIPALVLGGVETLDLMFYVGSGYFDLTSVVFEAKSLRKLCLRGCKLRRNSMDKVLFTHLHTLCLIQVYIDNEAFEKIMSSCNFIERVVLDRCPGLTTVRFSNTGHKYYYNLKHFDFSECGRHVISYDDHHFPIEIDVPTLETIKIDGMLIRYNHDHHGNMYFPRLKSMSLSKVRHYNGQSFEILSSSFPSLEELSIYGCGGFKELRLINPSIKRLTISYLDKSSVNRVTIDAPNIEEFVFSGPIPCSFSFTTTSIEWKSIIDHGFIVPSGDYQASSSSWIVELSKLLQAVSQSEISLTLWMCHHHDDPHIEEPPVINIGNNCLYERPVLVDKLSFSGRYSYSSFSNFLMCTFRSCRPRSIYQQWYANPRNEWEREKTQITEFLCKLLLVKTQLTEFVWNLLLVEITGRDERHNFWRRDLEEASMEVFDENGKIWHFVEETSFVISGVKLFQNCQNMQQQVCFKLKWRK